MAINKKEVYNKKMGNKLVYRKKVLRRALSFLRMLFRAFWYGSWQYSYEIESERVLFPEAYRLRKELSKRNKNQSKLDRLRK
jgi:hypothetical protein